jgi:hypothetical protein
MIKDTVRITVLTISAIIILSGIGALVYLTQNNWVVTTITTITTITGVFAIWLQMQKGKKLNEGEFILNLRKQFVDNSHIFQLTLKLEKYDRSDKIDNPFNEDDISDIAAYMTFFEVMYLLIKRNIIKLFMVDLLFAFHFFLLINNPRIQELELLPCQDYYLDVYRLYNEWITYRQEKNMPVYGYENNILSKLDDKLLHQINKVK